MEKIEKNELPYALFDSHAHYFDKRLDEIGGADKILKEEVFSGRVARVLNVGTNNENNRICVAQAQAYEGMYAAVGLHPEDIRYCGGSLDDELEALAQIIGGVSDRRARKIVALGEIGLDYHYEGFDKERQAAFFEAQMCLAEELDIPVIIHNREAHGDTFECVLRHPRVRGVFHSYSGSAEMAAELIRRGWYISFSGVVTFKNATRVREVVASVPLERMLIETDCPYLTPHPFRGRVNHSGFMEYTAEAIAEVKGTSLQQIADVTYKNASELFGI
ncbi:MAG: TatD family hydrolase [Clostridia bacterium]|nr:TatD family hydrolase [Clostridia bacterium]